MLGAEDFEFDGSSEGTSDGRSEGTLGGRFEGASDEGVSSLEPRWSCLARMENMPEDGASEGLSDGTSEGTSETASNISCRCLIMVVVLGGEDGASEGKSDPTASWKERHGSHPRHRRLVGVGYGR